MLERRSESHNLRLKLLCRLYSSNSIKNLVSLSVIKSSGMQLKTSTIWARLICLNFSNQIIAVLGLILIATSKARSVVISIVSDRPSIIWVSHQQDSINQGSVNLPNCCSSCANLLPRQSPWSKVGHNEYPDSEIAISRFSSCLSVAPSQASKSKYPTNKSAPSAIPSIPFQLNDRSEI